MESIRPLLLWLSLSFILTVVPGYAQSPICYAKPGGNDLNDGSYWAFAKADVMACYDALPPTGGTIYMMGGGKNGEGLPACKSSDPRGCGIWIMGKNDPNYPRPPWGWRKAKPVTFVGVGVNVASQQGSIPQVHIAAGSTASPGIWLSSSNISVSFENISMSYPNPSVQIGVDSNGKSTLTSGWVGASFHNIYTLDCNSCPSTNGPGWFIGGGTTLNIRIDDSSIQGNPNATPGDDNQSAILVKVPFGAAVANGLIDIRNTVLTGGGLKYYAGSNPSSLFLDNVYSEDINGGSVIPGVATVWLATGSIAATIKDVGTADSSGNVCDVRNDATNHQDPAWVTVFGMAGTSGVYVCGPAEILGAMGPQIKSPLRQGQEGFSFGRVAGFTGNAQRQFGLYGVGYQNLVSSSSTAWEVAGNGGSLTTGIAAPDGMSSASQLSGARHATIRFYNNGSAPWNLGDYWIASEWVRSPGGNYGVSALNLLASLSSGNTFSCSALNPPYGGDGEWFYKSTICKVTAAGKRTDWVVMSEGLNYSSTTQIYAPVLIRIPAGTVSDNEAYEIWNNLSSYSDTCPVRAMCGLPGKPVVVSSYGTLSNCSSSTSPAACGLAPAGSVVIAPGSSSVVVDTIGVTANSQITLTFDSSLGTKLGATCNIRPQQPYVTARTAGRSFTISVPNIFTTNPGCFSYSITN